MAAPESLEVRVGRARVRIDQNGHTVNVIFPGFEQLAARAVANNRQWITIPGTGCVCRLSGGDPNVMLVDDLAIALQGDDVVITSRITGDLLVTWVAADRTWKWANPDMAAMLLNSAVFEYEGLEIIAAPYGVAVFRDGVKTRLSQGTPYRFKANGKTVKAAWRSGREAVVVVDGDTVATFKGGHWIAEVDASRPNAPPPAQPATVAAPTVAAPTVAAPTVAAPTVAEVVAAGDLRNLSWTLRPLTLADGKDGLSAESRFAAARPSGAPGVGKVGGVSVVVGHRAAYVSGGSAAVMSFIRRQIPAGIDCAHVEKEIDTLAARADALRVAINVTQSNVFAVNGFAVVSRRTFFAVRVGKMTVAAVSTNTGWHIYQSGLTADGFINGDFHLAVAPDGRTLLLSAPGCATVEVVLTHTGGATVVSLGNAGGSTVRTVLAVTDLAGDNWRFSPDATAASPPLGTTPPATNTLELAGFFVDAHPNYLAVRADPDSRELAAIFRKDSWCVSQSQAADRTASVGKFPHVLRLDRKFADGTVRRHEVHAAASVALAFAAVRATVIRIPTDDDEVPARRVVAALRKDDETWVNTDVPPRFPGEYLRLGKYRVEAKGVTYSVFSGKNQVASYVYGQWVVLDTKVSSAVARNFLYLTGAPGETYILAVSQPGAALSMSYKVRPAGQTTLVTRLGEFGRNGWALQAIAEANFRAPALTDLFLELDARCDKCGETRSTTALRGFKTFLCGRSVAPLATLVQQGEATDTHTLCEGDRFAKIYNAPPAPTNGAGL